MKQVTLIQNEEKPISVEIIADAIIKIDSSMKEILNAGLSKRALLALLHDGTKIAKRDIELVLDGLQMLRKQYCTK